MTAHYDPPEAILETATLDDGAAAYHPLPVHVSQPRWLTPDDPELPPGAAAGPNPYVDYTRTYTAEGGVAITYKSDDSTCWHTFVRIVVWIVLMGIGSWLMLEAFATVDSCLDLSTCTYTGGQVKGGLIAFVVIGGLLALYLAQPVHTIHSLEIRSDCLILDGADVFWTAHMEARPTFTTDEAGAHILRGIYGTRHMEFIKLKPVDENDATPTVLANHIEEALKQLWDRPQVWAGA